MFLSIMTDKSDKKNIPNLHIWEIWESIYTTKTTKNTFVTTKTTNKKLRCGNTGANQKHKSQKQIRSKIKILYHTLQSFRPYLCR